MLNVLRHVPRNLVSKDLVRTESVASQSAERDTRQCGSVDGVPASVPSAAVRVYCSVVPQCGRLTAPSGGLSSPID
ncbi:hypothetical protein BaRGS_00005625 [Batillaria attramentaria]|uniref:Uncharacterized protein n=1 Tax=Batillaria attramentaria TaxID=370345 RepID=A0ABD0LTR4_9CAEN